MSVNPLRLIGGLVVAGLGFITGQGWLVGIGLSIAASAFGRPLDQQTRELRANTLSTKEKIPIVYGPARTGLRLAFRGPDPADPDVYWIVGALCVGSRNGEGIESIGNIYLDGELAIPEGAPSTGAGGLATTGAVAPFQGKIAWAKHLGSVDQAANPALLTALPANFDGQSRGRGIAYIVLRLTFDPDVYLRVPEVQVELEGRKLFDPRDGTWDYSRNAALAIRDFLADEVNGPGGTDEELDDASWDDAADHFDTTFTTPEGTEPIVEFGGLVDTRQLKQTNLRAMANAAGASVVYQQGKFRVVVRRTATPTGFVLDEEATVGDLEWKLAGLRNDGANSVEAVYIDPARNWQPQTVFWPEPGEVNPFLEEDNDFPSPHRIDLPFVVSRWQALRMARERLLELREADTFAATAKERALGVQVGDLIEISAELLDDDSPMQAWVMRVDLFQSRLVRLQLMRYNPDAYVPGTFKARSPIPTVVFPDPRAVADLVGLECAGVALCRSPTDGVVRLSASWDPLSEKLDQEGQKTISAKVIRVSYREEDDPGDPGPWQFVTELDPSETEVSFTVDSPAALTYRLRFEVVNHFEVRSPTPAECLTTVTRPAPDGTAIGAGDVAVETTAGVVQLTVDATGTNGTIFRLHVSSQAGFTVGPDNLVQTVHGAAGPGILFSFVPPVDAGSEFFFRICVGDCLTDARGEPYSCSQEFSSVWPGISVVTDPGFVSCENLAGVDAPGEHCTDEAEGDVRGHEYDLIDVEDQCIEPGVTRISWSADGKIEGEAAAFESTSPDGRIGRRVAGLLALDRFEQDGPIDLGLYEFQGDWSIEGGHAVCRAAGSSSVEKAYLRRIDIPDRTEVGCQTRVDREAVFDQHSYAAALMDGVSDLASMYGAGDNGFRWRGVKIAGGARTELCGGTSISSSNPYNQKMYADSAIPLQKFGTLGGCTGDVANPDIASGKVGLAVWFKAGVAAGRFVRYPYLATFRGHTVRMTGLPAGHKVRVSGSVTETVTATQTVTESGAVVIIEPVRTSTEVGTFGWETIEVLDAADAVVSSYDPPEGIWGGDIYEFDPAPQVDLVRSTIAMEFLTEPLSLIASVEPDGVSTLEYTRFSATALVPTGTRFIRPVQWKREEPLGVGCVRKLKVNLGTVATGFSAPRLKAADGLAGIPDSDAATTVTETERASIAFSGDNLLGPGNVDEEEMAAGVGTSTAQVLLLAEAQVRAGDREAFSMELKSAAGTDRLRAVAEFRKPSEVEIEETVSGLLFSDDFPGADGPPGGDWATKAGTWDVESNRLVEATGTADARINDESGQQGEVFIQARARHNDNVTARLGLRARFDATAGGDGYEMRLRETNSFRIYRFLGGSSQIIAEANPSGVLNADVDGILQFYVADGVQEAAVDNGTTVHTLSAANEDHNGVNDRFAGCFKSRSSGTPRAEFDDYLRMRRKQIRASGLPAGHKIQVLAAGDVLVAEAAAVDGVATINASLFDDIDHVPFGGWPTLVVLDAEDEEIGRFTGAVYPGGEYQVTLVATALVERFESPVVQSAAFTRADIRDIVVPAEADRVAVFAENLDETEAWSAREPMLSKGPEPRGFDRPALRAGHRDFGRSGPRAVLDFSRVQAGTVELTAAEVLPEFRGMADGAGYALALVQDGTGSRTVRWPDAVWWEGGSPPVLSTAAAARDVVGLLRVQSDFILGHVVALGAARGDRRIQPQTAHLLIVGHVPTVTRAIQPAAAHLLIVGHVPTVRQTVRPAAAHVVVTGHVPTVRQTVRPETAHMGISGYPPSVTSGFPG